MSDIYDSAFAKFLAKIYGKKTWAITTSKDCCRYSCSSFVVSEKWRKHEEKHKRQFAELGWLNFMVQYIYETIKNGYENNKFEVAARKAEKY